MQPSKYKYHFNIKYSQDHEFYDEFENEWIIKFVLIVSN